MYAVSLCSCTIGCEAYSFTTDGYGIFNVCTHLGAWRGVQEQISLWDSERQKNCSSHCLARGSNSGSSDLNSDSLTTELCPSLQEQGFGLQWKNNRLQEMMLTCTVYSIIFCTFEFNAEQNYPSCHTEAESFDSLVIFTPEPKARVLMLNIPSSLVSTVSRNRAEQSLFFYKPAAPLYWAWNEFWEGK